MLRCKTLWIDALAPNGKKLAASEAIALDAHGIAQLHVPPGTYRLQRRFDAQSVQSVEVTLEPNGEGLAVIDSSHLAAIAISVTVADRKRRTLHLRARDAHGSLAVLDVVRNLDGDTHDLVQVVEPGTYAVEVESRLKGAPSSEPALDVWRGAFTAVPGAQAPLRLHLR